MEIKIIVSFNRFIAYLINVSANKTQKLENLVWKSKYLTIFIQSISTSETGTSPVFHGDSGLCV